MLKRINDIEVTARRCLLCLEPPIGPKGTCHCNGQAGHDHFAYGSFLLPEYLRTKEISRFEFLNQAYIPYGVHWRRIKRCLLS